MGSVPRAPGALGGMFPTALGHGGGSCWTTGAERASGAKEGAACLDVEREGAAAGKDTILGSHAYTQGGAEGLHIHHEFLLAFCFACSNF